MHKILCLAGVVAALATALIVVEANAMSLAPVPDRSANVTLVAGGCGLGLHRGPYGACRPNAVGYPAVGYGGGVYRGGAYYRGGVYRRGVYHGGVYRGGVHRRGVYRR